MAQLSHYYYDIEFRNDTSDPVLMSYKEFKQYPILRNIQDFCLSLVKARVPSDLIPLMVWRSGVEYLYLSSPVNGGIQTQVTIPDPQPVTTPLFTGVDSRNYVFVFNQVLKSLNDALETAIGNLIGLSGGALPADLAPAYMKWNPETQLFEFRVPNEYADPANDITISFSRELYNLFTTFYVVQNANDDYALDFIYDNNFYPLNSGTEVGYDITPALVSLQPPAGSGYVTGGYMLLTQQFSSAPVWNQVRNILFVSDTLPIVSEQFSTLTGDGQTRAFNTLAEVDIPETDEDRTDYLYIPQAEFRRVTIALPRDTPRDINQIDLRVVVVLRDGRVIPLYLAPGRTFAAKIMFESLDKVGFDKISIPKQKEKFDFKI